MSRRPHTIGVGLAVLAACGLVVVALVLALGPQPRAAAPVWPSTSERFPNEWPTPPPAEVAALLDGLGPGSELVGPWRVRGVSPVLSQRVVVDVDRGDAGFRVWIVVRGRDERLPPRQTARYSLYTAQPRPSAEALTDEDYAAVLDALAERIERTESSAAVPAGM